MKVCGLSWRYEIRYAISGHKRRIKRCHHCTLIDCIRLFVSFRLYTQTHKRFKISEERVRDHVQTLGLFQQPVVEVLREPGDDPYDFKEGDIEYTFSTSKRLKSQGREPSKKAKVHTHSLKHNAVILKMKKN